MNNGLKWFEIIGKQGAVLGWGKCSVDGTMYGGQWHSGQSPIDVIKKKPWTGEMMAAFVGEVQKEEIQPTGASVAEIWVRLTEQVIELPEFENENDSKFNAVGIGYGNGKFQVWALIRQAPNRAESKLVWSLTQ